MSSSHNKIVKQEAAALVGWFSENSRPLPWRNNRKAYGIWISEIMLQQTTVTAVIPYYQKFMKRFPNLKSLADAPLEDVYQHWAGLGYYSRARNIHKAAKVLVKLKKFPKNHQELLKIPGLGDYTARAISSQAFGEKVGVVDGNVIRVLSRRYGLEVEHWKTKEKKRLQEIADQYAQVEDPSEINQAFMELGATICTPKSPSCLLCPIKKNCVALKQDLINTLPLKKPKRQFEIWHWNVELFEHQGKIAFIENSYAPFLKGQLILPGKVEQQASPPSKFDFQHGITHHKIYVNITRKRSKFDPAKNAGATWISRKQLKDKVPFSLIQKAIDVGLGDI